MSARIRGNALGDMGRNVAENVRVVRAARNLTQQQVSDALAALRHPIPVASIGRIESGDRRVEVDDLAMIATVLQVRPERLLASSISPASLQPWRADA